MSPDKHDLDTAWNRRFSGRLRRKGLQGKTGFTAALILMGDWCRQDQWRTTVNPKEITAEGKGLVTLQRLDKIFIDFSNGTDRLSLSILSKRSKGGIIKSLKIRLSVIPAKDGIPVLQMGRNSLDSGFHRSGDFFEKIM